MRILTAEAMQKVDRKAIDEFGIPSLVLMENAAVGVVDALTQEYPEAHSVAVFCGPGNNGGDGLAIGRHLAVRGYRVMIALVGGGKELRGDPAVQLTICRNMGLEIREVEPMESLTALLEEAGACDLVVDALFGTGLQRPIGGQFAELIAALNGLPVPRVAADLPSGLSGSRSEIFGPALEADLTVALAAPKVPHVFPPASALIGKLVVADLGIPPELIRRAEGDLFLIEGEDLAPLIGARPGDSHKGDYGHLLVVAGSVGKSGAAILTARGGIRVGAGLVTVAVPEPVLSTVEGASLESMAVPLPAAGDGLGEAALSAATTACAGKDALAVGPGLGTVGETGDTVRQLVSRCIQPLVVDADGLNAFAGRVGELAERKGETILTPHPGELSRLLGVETKEIVGDRVAAVRRAAAESQATVVLKGHLTLIADPLGGIYVNPTGNPGMATGGSGDVLTGMIAGFLTQGYESLDAARLGVYLHGLAGDLAAAEVGEAGLAAGDLLERVPAAVEKLART
jgi:NAD(P)H-hydrate epimerase